MLRLIQCYFSPPPIPELQLPITARMIPHAKATIKQALEFFYFRGAFDGFVLGVLVALLLSTSFRQKAIQGASHVAKHL